MKEKLKQELPFSLGNFIWRVFVPMALLLAVGFFVDRFLHTKHIFEYFSVPASLCITIWGIRVSLRENELQQSEIED